MREKDIKDFLKKKKRKCNNIGLSITKISKKIKKMVEHTKKFKIRKIVLLL